MSLGRYALGAAELVLVVGSLGVAARGLRRVVLAGWRGAPARLAEVVVGVALALAISELLGSVGLFQPGPVVGCAVAVAAVVWWLTRNVASSPAAGVPPPAHPWERNVALATGLLVLAQWAARSFVALGHGMWNVDTLWYHAPHAARFVQEGWVTGLAPTNGYRLIPFYPDNAELLHALAALPFHHDVVSPFLNLGALAVALLAGWCIGRPLGVAPTALVAVALALASPIFPLTQPGEAANDVLGAAFFLAAVGLLVSGELTRPSAAVAGLAAGVAVGTKLVAIGPVLALTAIVVVLSRRGRRAVSIVWWAAAVVAAGGFWYVRNLAEVGSPLPQLKLGLGSVALPHIHYSPAEQVFNRSLWQYVFDSHALPPGTGSAFNLNFSAAWPVVLALAAVGVVTALAGREWGPQRLLGVLALVCALFYALTPQTATLFAFDLRYAVAALVLGLVLVAVWSAGGVTRRRVTLGLLAAALCAVAVSYELRWDAGLGATVLGVGLAAAVGIAAVVVRRRRSVAVVVGLVALVAVAGWFAQRHYLTERYAHGPGAKGFDEPSRHLASLFAWARGIHHARVGVFGLTEIYPLYGTDLSNRVADLRGPVSLSQQPRLASCESWLAALRRDGPGYVVMTPIGYPIVPASEPPPQARWTEASGSATRVFVSGPVSVYRVAGMPTSCPSGAAGTPG
ncbi:MAG: hypothetical protein QOK25_675 [Thermoleophilaceae bacterium]|nr:hypothetical protein [Thermoleophilaceae bacterium]